MCPVLYYTMIRQSKDPKYIRLEIVWFAELSLALQICPTLKAKPRSAWQRGGTMCFLVPIAKGFMKKEILKTWISNESSVFPPIWKDSKTCVK